MKPAEVRRNDAVGQAVTIPYSRCHNQARVVADPTKNHRHSQRSWCPPEEHRAARRAYESYETSFVIRNDFDAYLIQPVYCTYRIPLLCKPSPTCEESRDHVDSPNWGSKLLCPSLLARIVFSIVPSIPSTAQRSMCELSFRKGSKGRELAIHHFSQGCRRTHTAPPSFSRGTELQDHATRSVSRPSDAAPHSALRSPSKSQTDSERTQTPDLRTNFFSTYCCAAHQHRGTT